MFAQLSECNMTRNETIRKTTKNRGSRGSCGQKKTTMIVYMQRMENFGEQNMRCIASLVTKY